MVLGRVLLLIYLLVKKNAHIFTRNIVFSYISSVHSQGNNKKTYL